MPSLHPGFSLAQLIEHTADELRALKRRPPQEAVMTFTGCELELAVTLKAEAGGKIKFWLVEANTKGAGETVSKVKLSFGPIKNDDDRRQWKPGDPVSTWGPMGRSGGSIDVEGPS